MYKVASIVYLLLILPLCANTQRKLNNSKLSSLQIEEAIDGLLIQEGSELTQFKKSQSVSLGKNKYPSVITLNNANRFINIQILMPLNLMCQISMFISGRLKILKTGFKICLPYLGIPVQLYRLNHSI